jgi:hypothetical protein
VKIGCNLAESSKEDYASNRSSLPMLLMNVMMMMVMMMIIIKMTCEILNSILMVQVGSQWLDFMNKVTNHQVPYMTRNFLTSC